MFPELLCNEAIIRRHHEAPFAAERELYLRHCFETGATLASLRLKNRELIWIARLLPSDAATGIDMAGLDEVVRRRKLIHTGATTGRRSIDIARPWLRFLGWWRDPVVAFPFQERVDAFVHWMRDERGFTSSTVIQWACRVKLFLQWCEDGKCQLDTLRPGDLDQYLIDGALRWCRVTMRAVVGGLRIFLGFAASQGWCSAQLAQTLRAPRVYALESLPYAPGWPDVQRILASTLTDRPADVRDRAILMLLSIYGLRRGEVVSLRLEQVDWPARMLRIYRLKRRQCQIYPLLPSVAEALARYVDTVRPRTSYSEIFLGLRAPQRPLTPMALYNMVNRKFNALAIQTEHRGPHALRHACAARLVAQGLSFKEIGDHLGHRSTTSTMTYAKVNMASLREVGDFDLGELL